MDTWREVVQFVIFLFSFPWLISRSHITASCINQDMYQICDPETVWKGHFAGTVIFVCHAQLYCLFAGLWIRIQYHIFEYMPSTELYYFQWLWGWKSLAQHISNGVRSSINKMERPGKDDHSSSMRLQRFVIGAWMHLHYYSLHSVFWPVQEVWFSTDSDTQHCRYILVFHDNIRFCVSESRVLMSQTWKLFFLGNFSRIPINAHIQMQLQSWVHQSFIC